MGGFLFQWIGLPLAALVAGFAAGWTVHGWRDGAADTQSLEHVVQVAEAQGAVSTAAAATDQAARDHIRLVTRTLVETIPDHVTPADDARCIVPLGFVREHDAAASGDLSALSGAPVQPDDRPSGLALSAVAATVADNYGACNETRRQLSDLEAWIAAERAVSR